MHTKTKNGYILTIQLVGEFSWSLERLFPDIQCPEQHRTKMLPGERGDIHYHGNRGKTHWVGVEIVIYVLLKSVLYCRVQC